MKFQSDFPLSHVVGIRLKRSLQAPLIDVCIRGRQPIDFAAEELCLALSVNRNCGSGLCRSLTLGRFSFISMSPVRAAEDARTRGIVIGVGNMNHHFFHPSLLT